MSKHALPLFLALAGLSVAFAAVSVLVSALGERPSLIRRKFRLGGMIIALNAALGACTAQGGSDDRLTCYGATEDTGSDSDSDTDTDTGTDTGTDTDTVSDAGPDASR